MKNPQASNLNHFKDDPLEGTNVFTVSDDGGWSEGGKDRSFPEWDLVLGSSSLPQHQGRRLARLPPALWYFRAFSSGSQSSSTQHTSCWWRKGLPCTWNLQLYRFSSTDWHSILQDACTSSNVWPSSFCHSTRSCNFQETNITLQFGSLKKKKKSEP